MTRGVTANSTHAYVLTSVALRPNSMVLLLEHRGLLSRAMDDDR
jgi:hypothetical protein